MKTIAGDIILHISTKNHNFEKNEKNMEMSSFYTCVHKITTYDACVQRYGV